MSTGDYVIANDLLGVILREQDNMFVLKDSKGGEHLVLKESCHEIVSSYALAASVFVKLRKRANSEKNKG